MLNVEQGEKQTENPSQPLTYGDYLRVPELLQLQTPLKAPPAHDEMLFIIVQQAQELWFKQALYELRSIIDLLDRGRIDTALRLLGRVNRILRVLCDEVTVLESMPPQEFQRFRNVLSTSSGFESQQFRELELASGLSDSTFIKLIEKHMDVQSLRARWPRSLNDAFLGLLARENADLVDAIVQVYLHADAHPRLYALAE